MVPELPPLGIASAADKVLIMALSAQYWQGMAFQSCAPKGGLVIVLIKIRNLFRHYH